MNRLAEMTPVHSSRAWRSVRTVHAILEEIGQRAALEVVVQGNLSRGAGQSFLASETRQDEMLMVVSWKRICRGVVRWW